MRKIAVSIIYDLFDWIDSSVRKNIIIKNGSKRTKYRVKNGRKIYATRSPEESKTSDRNDGSILLCVLRNVFILFMKKAIRYADHATVHWET